MIGASGIRILVDSQVDYGRSRNLTLTSVVFVTGLSGIAVKFGDIELTGMVLACVVAAVLLFFLMRKIVRLLRLLARRISEYLAGLKRA